MNVFFVIFFVNISGKDCSNFLMRLLYDKIDGINLNDISIEILQTSIVHNKE